MSMLVLTWILIAAILGVGIEVYALVTGRPTISWIVRDWVRKNRAWGWAIFVALLILFVHLLVPEI